MWHKGNKHEEDQEEGTFEAFEENGYPWLLSRILKEFCVLAWSSKFQFQSQSQWLNYHLSVSKMIN